MTVAPARTVDGVALWPGAGSSADHPTLRAVQDALAPLPVERFDFPYRREGRRAPDRANKLIASLRLDVAGLCERLGVPSSQVVLGGRSMGGRMASMAIAGATGNTARKSEPHQAPLPAAGLVVISYPLHPPGKPERLRTEHLGGLEVPVLSIAGDRDPFGTPDELAAAWKLVPGPVTTVTIEGAGHDLKGRDVQIVAAIGEWLASLRGGTGDAVTTARG